MSKSELEQQTEALARQLQHAIDHWDDPDQVAVREAYEAEKAERQAAIFELTYLSTGQRKPEDSLEQAIAKIVRFFSDRIETEAPGPAMTQPLPELDEGPELSLELDGDRLDLHVTAGGRTRTTTLHRGARPQIMALLRAPQAAAFVIASAKRLLATPPPRIPITRSSAEMTFYASLQRCPSCDNRVAPSTLKIYGQGDVWSLTGKCAHCGHVLAYPFTTDGDPIGKAKSYRDLGAGRSQLIAARLWSAEIARLLPSLHDAPSQLDLAAWRRHRDVVSRLETCVTELAKFLPAGADAIPDELLDDADRADRAAHPDRYRRAWLEGHAARIARIADAIVADLPRVNALEAAAATAHPQGGITYLDRDALLAHAAWVARGKRGKGRLVLVGAEHPGLKLGGGIELSGARLADADLRDVYLAAVTLDGAELSDVDLGGAHLGEASLRGASIAGGSLAATDLHGAALHDARLDGVAAEGVDLSGCDLDAAVLRRCALRGASLADGTTRGARFEDCDLRDTRWEGRDLSGAVFVRCRLTGASGTPARTDGIVFEGADAEAEAARRAWGLARR